MFLSGMVERDGSILYFSKAVEIIGKACLIKLPAGKIKS
ncbi:hypothetical protein THER_1980 [Thermodesulfovibrio sp. N1]|nr:hypothetical protein THER_1980 [Thermodesulfovibrio sp. N1]